MPKFISHHYLWLAIISLLVISHAQAAGLRANISSRFIVRGEQSILEYSLTDNVDPHAKLKVQPVPGLSIRPMGFGPEPRITRNRKREYVYSFAVTSYEPGNYTIPSATLSSPNGDLVSDAIELKVFEETALKWSNIRINGKQRRYAASFYVTNEQPYINEVQPAELKVYFPADQRIEDRGIPEFERDGIAAWRFEPNITLGRANILGTNYYVISYPSTLSPTRSGPVTIGPAKLRLITYQTSIENFGSAFYEPANLIIPALQLHARDLPKGAPEGFEDAIGHFELSVTSPETEIREGDPININIIVSGSGNLDTLNVPKPLDADGWKLYPASPVQRDVRREISGFAAFRQFMRPLRAQSSIPPFQLVYFDPETEQYETLISAAIPLSILPSTAPSALGGSAPPALPMPIEQMTDILGLINPAAKLLSPSKPLPTWSWQLVPAILAFILLASIAKSKLTPLLHKNPDKTARLRDLRQLERAPKDLCGFYRSAGHFVERWLGNSKDQLPGEILAKRDQSCFHRESSKQDMPRAERQKILRALRRLSLPIIIFALALAPNIRAENPAPEIAEVIDSSDPGAIAYSKGLYSEAARQWLDSGPYPQLSADTLYNIGNASYRLGAPGAAALYWRRALERDSSHPEARQNLRFFERKFGAITINRPDYQYTLAKLSLNTWKNLLWLGAWTATLSLLIFPATHSGSRLRILAITGLVAAPLIATTGACGWYYYPDDARFAPITEQAVVVSDRAKVRSDAARIAPLVIDAPAGSLCKILSRNGEWLYLAFTNETRGWVPSDEVETIIPLTQPEVPKPRSSGDEQKST